MNDVLCERRIREAIDVLGEEKRRLAAHLVMALTPKDRDPSSAEIHEAVRVFREGSDHLETARSDLKKMVPFDTTIGS